MADDSTSKDRTLLDYFTEGRRAYLTMDSGDSKALTQQQIKSAIDALEQALIMIDRMGLFSPNEEVEDIKTSSLKYLLVPYYLGSLYTHIQGMEQRLESLKKAKLYLSNYIENVITLSLLHPNDIRTYEQLKEGTKKQEDPATARTNKIERLKRKKEAEKLLSTLLQKAGLTRQDDPDAEESQDEEFERERLLRLVEIYAVSALENYEMTLKELEILEYMARMPKPPQGDAAPKPRQPSEGRPITIFRVDRRLQILKDVFKPSWIQPTMTVEEAGEIEMRLAQQREKERKKAEEEERRRKAEQPEVDSDDDDEKLRKKRAWDDWADENPRGSGNTGNKGYIY